MNILYDDELEKLKRDLLLFSDQFHEDDMFFNTNQLRVFIEEIILENKISFEDALTTIEEID